MTDFHKFTLRKPVFEPYVYREFPKFLFHAEHGEKIFNNQGEIDEAGEGWVDSPEKIVIKTEKKTKKQKAE